MRLRQRHTFHAMLRVHASDGDTDQLLLFVCSVSRSRYCKVTVLLLLRTLLFTQPLYASTFHALHVAVRRSLLMGMHSCRSGPSLSCLSSSSPTCVVV
ncbi:hypothetical protein BV20DRAFT_281771 [Pilatotrama ljubarskyi]|nr:hypothetical protein BV20DRAFT_281771 [Pilatotrama ljubarskyi]